jgi:hypothetical protein
MKLINECKNPPSGMLWQVRRSISWIFPGDLEGISCLKLIDQLEPAKEVSEPWYKKARKNEHFIRGWYQAADRTGASITLHIRDIYKCIPGIYRWTPVATLIITQTLAHEVGHHISRRKGQAVGLTGRLDKTPDKEEETRADVYAATVMGRMRRRLHYRLAAWAVNDLAQWHDVHAVLKWQEGKYKDAAERWYKSYLLDPYNERVRHCYWRAKQMCEGDST